MGKGDRRRRQAPPHSRPPRPHPAHVPRSRRPAVDTRDRLRLVTHAPSPRAAGREASAALATLRSAPPGAAAPEPRSVPARPPPRPHRAASLCTVTVEPPQALQALVSRSRAGRGDGQGLWVEKAGRGEAAVALGSLPEESGSGRGGWGGRGGARAEGRAAEGRGGGAWAGLGDREWGLWSDPGRDAASCRDWSGGIEVTTRADRARVVPTVEGRESV